MNKKIILTILLATVLIALIACSEEDEIINDEIPINDEDTTQEPPEVPIDDDFEEEDIDDVDEIEYSRSTYSNNVVSYETMVNKPTPCHEINHEAQVREDNVLEIRLEITTEEEICAQVITPELVMGEIESDQEPEDIQVIIE